MHSIEDLKAQAKRLRTTLADAGQAISHSQSLELLAKQLGYRDWNTLHGSLGNQRPGAPIAVGDEVAGTYLGQAFRAEVLGVSAHGPDHYRITLDLAEAVDVVKFDSFSALRSRVSATIDRKGVSPQKTSDGEPQLRLSL